MTHLGSFGRGQGSPSALAADLCVQTSGLFKDLEDPIFDFCWVPNFEPIPGHSNYSCVVTTKSTRLRVLSYRTLGLL